MPKAGQTATSGPSAAPSASERASAYALRSKDTAIPTTQKQKTTPKPAGSIGTQPASSADQPDSSDTPTQHNGATILHIIIESLDFITATHSMPEKLKTALAKIKILAKQAAEENNKAAGQQQLAASITALREFLKADLGQWRKSVDGKLERIAADQVKQIEAAEATAKSMEDMKASNVELKTSISKVNDTATKFSDSAKTYRDALMTGSTPPTHGRNADPRVSNDLDRKAKQILVEHHDEETANKSQTELKDKANGIIATLSDTSPPEGTKVENVLKLRNGGIILQMNNKEAAKWLRDIEVELLFTKAFAKDSIFKDRQYNILVPRIPLTFEPGNKTHLREVEEANGLSSHSIMKARWIKPEYRRSPGQKLAHATLSISSAETANKLIRDGMYICNSRVTPTKLKQEPLQCMKCRGWGHVAASCLETTDTCGTCGGEHRTRNCDSPNKVFCASCKADTHTSWDRKCPEFIRRCALHNDRHPENSLTYFPTDEDWTLSIIPERIPTAERFPAHLAVASLPPPSNKQCPPPTRPITKRSKQPRHPPTVAHAANQATLDNFIQKSQPKQGADSTHTQNEASDKEDDYDYNFDKLDEVTERLLNDGAYHEIPGWD